MIGLVYFLAGLVQLQRMFVCWRCNAMPCLLWAAVMWVRSISEGRLSVWLHSSMLSAGQSRRSPRYRPEHNPPGQLKVNLRQSEHKEERKKERENRGQREARTDYTLFSTRACCCAYNQFSWCRKCLKTSLKAELLQKLLNKYKISETNSTNLRKICAQCCSFFNRDWFTALVTVCLHSYLYCKVNTVVVRGPNVGQPKM